MTEIKRKIFGQVWLLKDLFIFYFECLYDIPMFLFDFWLRNSPPIKYVRKGGNVGGGSSKICTDVCRGRKVEKSVVRYIHAHWIAPK